MSEHGTDPLARRLSTADGRIGVDVFERRGHQDGPHVVVLGGVHGDEVGGIVAAGTVADTVGTLRAGRLTVIPVAHEAARRADMRVSPEDGGNLARSFPGRAHGSRTEQLAHLLTSEVLAHADVIVDLHTSNSAADMPLFVGCLDDGSAAADEAVRLAFGLGMPMLWTHPRLGPGRTLTVAAERGIPALYVESPLGGVLERRYVDAYTDGVRAVLEACGLVAAETPPRTRPTPALWVHGDGDTDAFSAVTSDGFFERIVALLDPVRRGDPVGRVIDVFGREQEIVIAPSDGIVTTLQRAAAVVSGQPVVGVTPVRPGVLGLASDDLVTTRNPL